jgi:hypothetical protein
MVEPFMVRRRSRSKLRSDSVDESRDDDVEQVRVSAALEKPVGGARLPEGGPVGEGGPAAECAPRASISSMSSLLAAQRGPVSVCRPTYGASRSAARALEQRDEFAGRGHGRASQRVVNPELTKDPASIYP